MTTRSYAGGQQSEPHQPRSRLRSTVEFLRLVTFRHLKGNATDHELRQACEMVLTELPKPAAPTVCLCGEEGDLYSEGRWWCDYCHDIATYGFHTP